MAKNSGKAFELAIRKSFDAHGWWCLRITDNVYATGASVKTPADFIAVSKSSLNVSEDNVTTITGDPYLIECKSTEQTSLPLSNITEFQRNSLTIFDGFGAGILMVLFKKSRSCYAILAQEAFEECESQGRKSLTEKTCQEVGILVPKNGAIYNITVLEQLL